MTTVAALTRNPFTQGLTGSAFAHAAVIGAAYFFLVVRQPNPITVELDLSIAPRVAPLVARKGKPQPRPSKKWVAPAAGIAPAPVASATESMEEEEVADACPPPCPDRPGDFMASALTKRPPRWVGGFIDDSDYPRVARKQGQDGKVVVRVFIDAAGKVRDVQLLKGSYPALNEAAMAKVRQAEFSPAIDDSGRPVPAKLILPIRFELY